MFEQFFDGGSRVQELRYSRGGSFLETFAEDLGQGRATATRWNL